MVNTKRSVFLAVLASGLAAAAGYGQSIKAGAHITPQTTSEYMVDGGFEQATQTGNNAPGWIGTTNVPGNDLIWTGPVGGALPHSGNNYAFLGDFQNGDDTLAQTVSIPSNATAANLSFWTSIATQESGGINYDFLDVEIWSLSGVLLGTPFELGNTDSVNDNNNLGVYFHTPNIDLSGFAGQTVQIVFHATNDSSLVTDFLIDDVSLQVTATFQTAQGGGSSGNGQAISLSSLGVSHGGLFWFFNASNPELLIKVLNGCGVNNHFWIFASAGTNVGVQIIVVDTVTGAQVVYNHPDGQALQSIKDTSAFNCP